MNTATILPNTIDAVILTNGRAKRCLDCARHTANAISGVQGGLLVINNHSSRLELPESIKGVPCRLIELDRNLGVQARNISFPATNAEFLLMLDDDAYVNPEPIERMISVFRKDSTIAAVCFRVHNNGREESCLLPTVFHGCACGFRTSALKSISGYPTGFLYYGEEYQVAFRLYGAGYRILMLADRQEPSPAIENRESEIRNPDWVYHARDGGGRNKNRILRLLVRNNTYVWFNTLPLRHILQAVCDTVRRYSLVARKERACVGFILGCLSMPWSIARALFKRRPLYGTIFRKIALIDQLEAACGRLKEIGAGEIVICGIGKFPSIWLRILRKHGISVEAFLDTNACWSGQTIRGIAVHVTDQSRQNATACDLSSAICLVGLSSMSETVYWKEQMKQRGLARLLPTPTSQIANHQSAIPAPDGTSDLLEDIRLELWRMKCEE